ncbi:MAG: LPS export ABC transporter periplasmic protein LptC [Gemmatimonadota bacterium]|nr:LPS export ABC transporter periplasmic protein LptC [Gemmatimonadota bacterium]
MGRAVLVLVVAMGVAAGCSRSASAPPVGARDSLADSAEQVMLNVRSLLTDHGIQRGEMFADSVYIFDENTRFELRKVRATFNTSTGVKDGTMTANRGRYNLRQQILEGFGNVVITTNDGKRLTSPQVRYNQLANEVSSDTNFTMVEPGRTLSGIGFRSDPQLTHVRVLRAPRGQGSFTLPGQ